MIIQWKHLFLLSKSTDRVWRSSFCESWRILHAVAAKSKHSGKQYLEQGSCLFEGWKGLEKNIHYQEGCALGCNVCNIYLRLEDRFLVFHPLSQSCRRGGVSTQPSAAGAPPQNCLAETFHQSGQLEFKPPKKKKQGNVPVSRSRRVVYQLSQSMDAILSKHTWRLAYFPKWLLSLFFFFFYLSGQVRND